PRPPCSPLFPYTTLFRSSALYLDRTQVLEADLEAGGTLSPRGSRILSMFPPVFAPSGQVFVQVFTQDGMEILASRRVGFSTVLADRKSTRLNSSHVKISY